MEKDPAAVALGKKRQAKMTDAERAAFAQAAAAAHAKRTFDERKRIARKAAMTKRMRGPKWIAPVAVSTHAAPALLSSGVDEIIHLDRAIDELPDELLETLASALFARPA